MLLSRIAMPVVALFFGAVYLTVGGAAKAEARVVETQSLMRNEAARLSSQMPDAATANSSAHVDQAQLRIDGSLVDDLDLSIFSPEEPLQTKEIEGGQSVSSQAISLPSGPSSVTGMGESFSPQLSTGIATYQVPFQLPVARGGVQPALSLAYSSAGGFGVAGFGWSTGASAITRQTDRGLPGYDDQSTWHPEQDRFSFGGTELVPICNVSGNACDGAIDGEAMPTWANGWQYFRSRIEGTFLRFFWSPDHRTWRVQSRDGSNIELGVPLDGSGYEGGLQSNPDDDSEVFRWYIVRHYDSQGAVNVDAPRPVNTIHYRYLHDGDTGAIYLSDIFDTSPASDPTSSDVSKYAHHTRLVYETRPDSAVSFRSGWRVQHALRLAGVDVTSKTFQGNVADPRELVRRYHLSYDPDSHTTLLTAVQMEGRCDTPEQEDGKQELFPTTGCPTLPPLTFEYQRALSSATPLTDAYGYNFEPLSGATKDLPSSPPHSLDDARTGLMDVNSDGLPDVVVTSPGQYDGDFGVFFNGAGLSGDVGFGAPEHMPVEELGNVDEGALQLTNRRVATFDQDGDGRVNLVHIAQDRFYSVFEPKETADGWVWRGHNVSTVSKQDVKIDFTGNRRNTRVMDVNGDGLVDVVSSSATEFQTFFALGRYPGGDDQFGSAKWTSASTAEISNDPVTKCVPWSATPASFSDADVHVGDLNGDGLPDIARIRSGQLIYWPGRGNGFWGTGDRDDCRAGAFGTDRHIVMQNGPKFGVTSPGTLLLGDVNGDGYADLVEIRTRDVDVYLNDNGQGWTDRHVITNTPVRPSISNYVRITDIDGSGSPDILWGRAHEYRYIDLTGGVVPHQLIHAENGLGMTSDLDYTSSSELMLQAEASGKKWTSKAPTIASVLTSTTLRDNLHLVGRSSGTYVTRYRYRDPVFAARERAFRGFKEAETYVEGDATSPSSTARSRFMLGECPETATGTAAEVCTLENRWKDNWRDGLSGLTTVAETFDENGVYITTEHTSYRLEQLYTGLDGRRVVVAYPFEKNALGYDTSAGVFDDPGEVVSMPGLQIRLPDYEADEGDEVFKRSQNGTVSIRSTTVYDEWGNVTQAIRHGCESGCPEGADETITATSVYEPVDGDDSGWLQREVHSYITGSVNKELRNEVRNTYNERGRLLTRRAVLSGTLPLARRHADGAAHAPDPAGASGGEQAPVEILLIENTYDKFGHVTFRRAAGNRCSSSDLDTRYAQLTVASHSYAGKAGADGCGELKLTGSGVWDRGLEAVTDTTSAHGQPSHVEYDGFGRFVSSTSADPDNPGNLATVPNQIVTYRLPEDPTVTPYTTIMVRLLDGANVNVASYHEGWGYSDGMGRSLAALTQADRSAGDDGDWVVGRISDYDVKGQPVLEYEPWFYSGDAADFPLGQAPPGNFTSQEYDAFGRPVTTYALNGDVVSHIVYHAMSEDVYDAADLAAGPRQGTFLSKVSDGHGRGVRRTERVHVGQAIEERHALNEYLPTGEVLRITQRRDTGPDIVRWLRYDSLGRVVMNVEPNTSVGFNPDPNTPADDIAAWRYAYNDAGELVGTSDARGCGVNYHYDVGGRMIAEDRSPCLEHHAAYTAPNLTTGEGTEVFNRYDTPDPDSGDIVDDAGARLEIDERFLIGRLVSVSSLGSKSIVRYDALGRSTGGAKRVAKPGTPSRWLAERYAPRWYVATTELDAVGRAITTTTGVTTPELLGADGTSELRYTYTKRGSVRDIESSYGRLLDRVVQEADGRIDTMRLGDEAKTERGFRYDARRRVRTVQTYRGTPSLWSSPAGSDYTPADPRGPPTTQLLLEDLDFERDSVGNITAILDYRLPEEWPDKAKPVTRRFDYDDRYRLTRVRYEYEGGNAWESPYAAENADADLSPQPMPHVAFNTRVTEERFSYDWLGNLETSSDDQNAFWDRSLGDTQLGTPVSGPHQLRGASNKLSATSSTRQGELEAEYDAGGNLTGLVVRRDGDCLPAGSSCWQRFHYEWSETDELVHAQRWDLKTELERGDHGWLELPRPSAKADAELRYSYGAGGGRVRKTIVDATQDLHALYISSSIEVRRTSFEGEGIDADYRLGASEVELRLPAGMATARVIYSEKDLPTKTSQQKQHLFLSLSDTVGSTSIVIDHATGELVEHATYMAYGTSESSYRTERWGEERDPYRFGGKEEDIEVGLSYFGARYYSPFLGAWMSPDPVTIHQLSSDTNPYAYVYGSPLMGIDPDGRFAFTAILVGMAVGALLGAGTSVAVQASTGNGWDLNRVNGWKVLGAAVVGAVAGAVSGGVASGISGIGAGTAGGAFGSTIGGAAVSGAVAGAAGGAASFLTASALHGTASSNGARFSWGGLGKAMAMGAVGGALGGGAGNAAGGEFLGAMTGGVTGAAGGYGMGLAFGAEFSTETLLMSIGGGIAGAVAGATVGRRLGEAIDGAPSGAGSQRPVTAKLAQTHTLVECGGNIACGAPRAFGSDPMDQMVTDFLEHQSLDSGYGTVADAIVEDGPEHTAPIIQRRNGTLRLGQLFVSRANNSAVNIEFAPLQDGERYVGMIHSHPGTSPGTNLGHSDVDVPGVRALRAALRVPAFRSYVVARAADGPYFGAHTFEVTRRSGTYVPLTPP